jgi:hypothetical protein
MANIVGHTPSPKPCSCQGIITSSVLAPCPGVIPSYFIDSFQIMCPFGMTDGAARGKLAASSIDLSLIFALQLLSYLEQMK